MFISKHVKSKYLNFVIKFNMIVLSLSFSNLCYIHSEYKEFLNNISGSANVQGEFCIYKKYML